METVLIAGGSGTVGKHLSKMLLEKGYKVTWLSRHKNDVQNIKISLWDVENKFIEDEAISSADYIINLSGARIGDKRWNDKRKKEIIDSRVNSNKLIIDKVQKLDKKLKAYITASAVGYYGAVTTDKIFTEDDMPANDFLGTTCDKWEASTNLAEEANIRTVKIRTGVVLNKGDGALSKIILPIKMFAGSPLGSGKQYMPWIHIEDLCNIFIKSIEDSKMVGAYNAVAPEHVSNKEFTKTLANKMNKPMIAPNVPSFVLKLIFGEMSKIVLEGSRISSEKISKLGFVFLYKNIKSALDDLVSP